MARMTPKEFVTRLESVLGDGLVSITLYGPTALEEETCLPDDVEHPILIVTEQLDLETLTRLAQPVQEWRACGHPKPLCFTRERLKLSSDSFPVELLDMKEARKVLLGEDSILKLEVRRTYFQQELITKLKTELLELRSSFLEAVGDSERLRQLLVDSLAGVRLLLRGVLRMYIPHCPSTHAGVLESLKIHLSVDAKIYQQVAALRNEATPESSDGLEVLFSNYLTEIEKLADSTDALRIKRAGSTYPPFRG